ncbi:O-6-alkylguanine-DNA alkyltransferase [Lasioglossum baleicum]|uniref:O-6-alkylguanine-DNA alkyltransferase n=1 Tax=Lasioglossum baleicum TaxID=434251 RepID=UPI003FCD16D0
MVRSRTMTPQEYKRDRSKFKIIYGFQPSPFGACLLGLTTNTDKAIVFLAFADGDYEKAFTELKNDWPLSELVQDYYNETYQVVHSIFSPQAQIKDSLTLLLMGSEFQIKVWRCLLSIPVGTTVTYDQVAIGINNPKAARSVGNAIMKNKVGYLIPCHRVNGKYGSNKYKWGTKIKEAIMFHEYKLRQPGSGSWPAQSF